MQHLLDAVRQSVQAKNFYGALSGALTLPDIAAKLDGRSGGSKARYISWYNDFVLMKYTVVIDGRNHVFLSGNDCYALRCAFLHEGEFDITGQSARDILEKFNFVVPFSNFIYHKNQFDRTLFLQVDLFCIDIIRSVEEWMRVRGSDVAVAQEMSSLPLINFVEWFVVPAAQRPPTTPQEAQAHFKRFIGSEPITIEDQIPTEDEVRNLPLWARVAFAARCANLVSPLISHRWSGPPGLLVGYQNALVSVASAAANGKAETSSLSAAKDAINHLWPPWEDATDPSPSNQARAAARSAAEAALASKDNEQNLVHTMNATKSAFAALAAVRHPAFAAQHRLTWDMTNRPIMDQFEKIKEKAAQGGWTNESRVSQEDFGSMPGVFHPL
jgi:hypothetical protein